MNLQNTIILVEKSVSNTFIGEDTNEEILILNDKEISYKKKC